MKSFFYTIIGLVLFTILHSCSADLDGLEENTRQPISQHEVEEHKITETKATDIANNFFKETRGGSPLSVNYIVNNENGTTRSTATTDTLAYIFNRGENDGFIIVATDDRVFPILAFSEDGHFSYEEDYNDIDYANFVSLIDDYMATIEDGDTAVIVPQDFPQTCISILPKLAKSWHQKYPYNKYVIQEHPGCPVGCVALAAGQAMTYGKDFLEYHDSTYVLHAIRTAFKESLNFEGPTLNATKRTVSANTRIIGGLNPTKYTYIEAVDKVARMLYWIGKDVDMEYHPSGSGSYSSKAYDLLEELDYNVKPITPFIDSTAMRLIMNDYIIYTFGTDDNKRTGHAWIIDGGYFCWEDSNKEIIGKPFFHCDWGWGGDSNGYYSTQVIYYLETAMPTDKYFWRRLYYFAVGR